MERTLWHEGRAVALRPKVFDILLALVERHGRLVEKEELMRAVWPEQFVEEGNLNKNVSRRRHAARIPYGCPKRERYSVELRKALTISACS